MALPIQTARQIKRKQAKVFDVRMTLEHLLRSSTFRFCTDTISVASAPFSSGASRGRRILTCASPWRIQVPLKVKLRPYGLLNSAADPLAERVNARLRSGITRGGEMCSSAVPSVWPLVLEKIKATVKKHFRKPLFKHEFFFSLFSFCFCFCSCPCTYHCFLFLFLSLAKNKIINCLDLGWTRNVIGILRNRC